MYLYNIIKNKNTMKNKLFKYSELSERSKSNASWEVRQRNSVSKYVGRGSILTIDNSLFFINGVYAERV